MVLHCPTWISNTAQTRLSRQSAQSRRKAAHWCSRRPRPGSIWSVRAAAFALCDLGGDHPPRDRLAAPQVPEPRRPDAHAEPATADPSRRYGRRVRAHRGTVATGPPDAGCQREQPGGVVLRRAAARQSGPQLGSGRSPQQHGHVRRSMATVAGATGRPGTYVLHQRSQDRTAYPIHHFRVREHAVDWTGRTGLTDLLLTARHGSEFARQRL
jgi:hypothetical protein